MSRHPFQPFAAILGIAVVVLGVLVASFGFEELGDDALAWAAVAVGAMGVALIPWRSRTSAAPSSSASEPTEL